MDSAVLLITAPDRPGLVALVAGFLYDAGANIVHADQHIDREHGLFLQRVEFELEGLDARIDGLTADFAVVAAPLELSWSLHPRGERQRVAVLVSKLGHCLYDLLGRWAMGELAAEIALVVSNHEDHRRAAEQFGVPFHHLPVTPETKPAQERQLHQLLSDHGVQLVVLARYMQILSADFVARWPNRIINIHHSFLPAFVGARPYRQAYTRGVKLVGATSHYVTTELDAGPIIEQDVVRVSHRDDVAGLIAKGRDLETVVLARAVAAHLDQRVLAYGNRTAVFT